MIYYYAYGSNLHHLQMKRRCPNCKYIKKITLQNYTLTFRSKYGAADIEKKRGGKVFGALYTISKAAEKRLDIYEEYPDLVLGQGAYACSKDCQMNEDGQFIAGKGTVSLDGFFTSIPIGLLLPGT